MDVIRLKLTIAFEGTRYEGWQVQKTGVGVQQVIEEALSKLFPSKPRLHSSSRTDTGVHALGMVAHIDLSRLELRMTGRKLPLAVNAHLPEDIRVLSASRCPAEFHARFGASGKQYRYYVWNHAALNPLLRRQAWLVHRKLNLAAMRSAARHLVGRHDFASFAASQEYRNSSARRAHAGDGSGNVAFPKSTVRTLTRCDIRRSGPLLTFIIEADGFLYRMCRGIVGTLVQIGLGKFPSDSIEGILERKDRRAGGMSAPAHGLVLWRVFYRRRKQ